MYKTISVYDKFNPVKGNLTLLSALQSRLLIRSASGSLLKYHSWWWLVLTTWALWHIEIANSTQENMVHDSFSCTEELHICTVVVVEKLKERVTGVVGDRFVGSCTTPGGEFWVEVDHQRLEVRCIWTILVENTTEDYSSHIRCSIFECGYSGSRVWLYISLCTLWLVQLAIIL